MDDIPRTNVSLGDKNDDEVPGDVAVDGAVLVVVDED